MCVCKEFMKLMTNADILDVDINFSYQLWFKRNKGKYEINLEKYRSLNQENDQRW